MSIFIKSQTTGSKIPGLLLTCAITAIAIWISQIPVIEKGGFSVLTLALIIGLILGNTVYSKLANSSYLGVNYAKAQLLRIGIVFYGLRLTFQDVGDVGFQGVLIDVLMLSSTFFLAVLAGVKVLGMDVRRVILIGAGSSICGAAAVLATEPVVKGRIEDVSVAVATVVVFGTIGMFLYPALFHWNAAYGWFLVSETQYGLYVGSTVHEVAQVVAAGDAISDSAADVAVISKMVRVMMLAPFLLMLSIWLAKKNNSADIGSGKRRIVIPWFAVGFIVMAGVNSLGVLPDSVVAIGITLDNILLAVAMSALGLTTHIGAVRAAGPKPLILAALLFVWLVCAGLLLNLVLIQ